MFQINVLKMFQTSGWALSNLHRSLDLYVVLAHTLIINSALQNFEMFMDPAVWHIVYRQHGRYGCLEVKWLHEFLLCRV